MPIPSRRERTIWATAHPVRASVWMGVLSSGLFTIWAVTSLHYRWLRALGFAALTLVVFFGFCYMGLRGG